MALFLIKRVGATDDERPRVVEARKPEAAIAHVAGNAFTAEPISTAQAMEYAANGTKHEQAAERERKPRGPK